MSYWFPYIKEVHESIIKQGHDNMKELFKVIDATPKMNNRLKELAEHAELYARSDNSSMVFENFMQRYTEKLAELIIDECIDVVIDCDEDPKCIVHEPHRTIIRKIKDHFEAVE